MSFDVITMGRIGVDVYPLQTGVSLREVESFGKFLGGSPTNVAVAAARYGRSAAVDHAHGRGPVRRVPARRAAALRRRRPLRDAGAGPPDARSTFCEIFPPDDFPLYFYREPKAPDLEIHARRARPRRDPRGRRVLGHRHRALAGAQPHGDAGRAGGARQARHHGPRPRLPADVLGLARGGPRAGGPRAAARHRRGRQPRRVGDRGRRRATRARRSRPRASAASSSRSSSRARGRARRARRRRSSRSRRCRSRSSTASAPATRSAARCATACWPAGSSSA